MQKGHLELPGVAFVYSGGEGKSNHPVKPACLLRFWSCEIEDTVTHTVKKRCWPPDGLRANSQTIQDERSCILLAAYNSITPTPCRQG